MVAPWGTRFGDVEKVRLGLKTSHFLQPVLGPGGTTLESESQRDSSVLMYPSYPTNPNGISQSSNG